MTGHITNGSGLAGLPSEILSKIIRCLLDDITTNKRSGQPHDYYTQDYQTATAQSTKALVTLCLVSRRLRDAATLSLYRHVTLVPRKIPGSVAASRVALDDGVMPLTLFLRTLVQRPDLRPLVQTLDCQFFLRHAESTPASLESSKSALRYQEDFQFHKQIIESTTRPPLSQEDLILNHVAATNPGRVNDTCERALAAILCLVSELRSLSLPPLPHSKWLIVTDDEWELYAPQNEYHYNTLSSLVETARQSEFSACALQHLEAVRFTGWRGFDGFNSDKEVVYNPPADPTLPDCPDHTFPLSSCLNLLLGPNITDFKADAVDEVDPDQFRKNLPMHSSIKRASLTISYHLMVLNFIGRTWDLSALTVRPARAVFMRRDEGMRPHIPNLDAWDNSLLSLKGSLKELDIGWMDGYEFPSHRRLNSLPLLGALEHLCIGIPLLAGMAKFSESPLHSVLPPNLRTLRLHDWVTGNYYDKYLPGFDLFELAEDEVEDGLKPLVTFQIDFSASLRSFAQVCGTTHPHLRSIMVFGFRPIDKAASESAESKAEFYLAARQLELVGTEPGQVVRGGGGIQVLFAQTGVVFEELFHEQEIDLPFQAQVSRYQ
ncbi:unnamed protein product [Clonostachys solani]|uniref:Uncharacterized protein n=1 Tax=Clonostachys solani TaxID=160281 RepID=A0A9P0ENV3_9HYPO|nr:unnamed protein product [Clonostachys solani]